MIITIFIFVLLTNIIYIYGKLQEQEIINKKIENEFKYILMNLDDLYKRHERITDIKNVEIIEKIKNTEFLLLPKYENILNYKTNRITYEVIEEYPKNIDELRMMMVRILLQDFSDIVIKKNECYIRMNIEEMDNYFFKYKNGLEACNIYSFDLTELENVKMRYKIWKYKEEKNFEIMKGEINVKEIIKYNEEENKLYIKVC